MITRKTLLALLGGLIAAMLVIVACSEDRSYSYDVHPMGWMDQYSENFHGDAAVNTGGESCGACHALENTMSAGAGDKAIGCYVCHGGLYPHLWSSRVPGHKSAIHDQDFDLSACSECHGADFTGGSTGVSCLMCHTEPAGVADCNLCHALPPVDNDGLPATYNDGAFGAHAAHARYACTECHAPVNGLAHIDGLPAEVDFRWAEIATLRDMSPVSPPPADPASGNRGCGSVYCHGGESVNWLEAGSVMCTSCHAVPPASSIHMQGENRCHICHWGVSPESDYENAPEGIFFLPENEDEHVNGVVNVQVFEL